MVNDKRESIHRTFLTYWHERKLLYLQYLRSGYLVAKPIPHKSSHCNRTRLNSTGWLRSVHINITTNKIRLI